MSYIALEKILPEKNKSLYKTVLIAAARANELAAGAQPLVKIDSKKVSTIALTELFEKKVKYAESKTKSKKSLD